MAVNSLSTRTWRYRFEKLQWVRLSLADRAGAWSGWVSRRLRWPLPFRSPRRWDEVHVLRVGGIGDAIMSTPGLRVIKREHPGSRIIFYSVCPDLFRGLPYLDEVKHCHDFSDPWAVVCSGDSNVDVNVHVNYQNYYESLKHKHINFTYENTKNPRRHLACVHGDHLGVAVTNVVPDCVVPREAADRFAQAWSGRPRPWVVVNRASSPSTMNKEWLPKHWEALMASLLVDMTIIDVGAEQVDDTFAGSPNYVDLRGKTTLSEVVAAISVADVHVGPVSGPMHIAAAVGTPSVVIYGGREPPRCTAYPNNINLFQKVPCSPCWLLTPCPYDRKCMQWIRPKQVEAAIGALWEGRRMGGPSRGVVLARGPTDPGSSETATRS
jgi:ADP-heptose:LPS heptosyltransferase